MELIKEMIMITNEWFEFLVAKGYLSPIEVGDETMPEKVEEDE